MCIAILKTKNGIITDDAIENSFYNNPDGAGLAYALHGKIHIEKGFFNCAKFIKRIREIEAAHNPTMLIHCRISTSGLINKSNAHPHVVNDDLCLIHNGILDIYIPLDSKKSDTRVFIKKYLSELMPDDLKNPTVKNLITKFIGKSNKFVFLDKHGNYTICNESAGHWENNVWYSNESHKPPSINYFWDDYAILSDFERLKIKKTIVNLTEKEFLKIGINPMINLNNAKIISEHESFENYSPDNRIYYLDDINTDLYNIYMNTYDKTLENSVKGVLL